MKQSDIVQGGIYAQKNDTNYFRQVELICKANPVHHPGRYRVVWSTDGFNVRSNNGQAGRNHGSCFLETFARWAQVRLE
jgi:hypothetical protein